MTKPQLRVALIAAGEVFGGAERQILTLLDSLDTDLFRTALITFHDRALANRCRELGIPVHVLEPTSAIDRSVVEKLRALLREERIDVLHIHGYKACAYAALATVGRQKPRVIKTEHGAVEAHDERFLANLKPRVYRLIENVGARLMNASLVYVTEDLRSRCEKEHRGLQTQVIYNGVKPTARTAPDKTSNVPSDGHRLLVAGRLERVKGIDTAIRAIAGLSVAGPLVLDVIGEGPEREYLEELTRIEGVTDRVTFHGFQSNVPEFLARATCLLMPSIHEGLPYTLLEAMSLHVPAIASRVGGLAEVLKDGETALLVPPGDAGALAASIDRLLSDSPLRRMLAESAYMLVNQKFNARNMGSAYARLYTGANN